MNINQLRKFVEKEIYPLLGSEFEYSDTLIYRIDSNNEILKGYFFENSKNFKNGIYVHRFVQPMMIISEDLYFNFGSRLRTINDQEVWLFEEKSILDLIEKIKTDELHEAVTNSVDFINYFSKKASNVRDMEAITYCCCYADIKYCKNYLRKLIDFIEEDGNLNWKWVENIHSEVTRLLNLSENEVHNVLTATVEQNLQRVKNGWYRKK